VIFRLVRLASFVNLRLRAEDGVDSLIRLISELTAKHQEFQCGPSNFVCQVCAGTICLGRVKFPSKPSIPFRVFSVFPITWGICS
jgi:hypothetical protein